MFLVQEMDEGKGRVHTLGAGNPVVSRDLVLERTPLEEYVGHGNDISLAARPKVN